MAIPPEVWMIVGFLLASYSIVANDAIQTLGTFLSSNSHRSWIVLWIYASSILVAVILFSVLVNNGDPSFGRLERFPEPDTFYWYFIIPPLFLLALTRFGFPVSTTFLVLTVFRPENLGDMLTKSLLGYGTAFLSAIVIYILVSKFFERYVTQTKSQKPQLYWVIIQWLTTAFLWSQWLIQDLANIFVFLPRNMGWGWVVFSLLVMVILHGWIFYSKGGKIQKIVLQKTNTTDIRSASLVDLIYGIILFIFKNISNIPMSTTWVFLGLLAGRELAIALRLRQPSIMTAGKLIGLDLSKAASGLAISVLLAIGLPALAERITPGKAPPPPSVDAGVDSGEPFAGPLHNSEAVGDTLSAFLPVAPEGENE